MPKLKSRHRARVRFYAGVSGGVGAHVRGGEAGKAGTARGGGWREL
jgi:hypothetical protein